jgi:hypothetical protein
MPADVFMLHNVNRDDLFNLAIGLRDIGIGDTYAVMWKESGFLIIGTRNWLRATEAAAAFVKKEYGETVPPLDFDRIGT